MSSAIAGDYRGLAADALWHLSGCYAQREGTDGVVPRIEAIRVVLNPAMVDELAALLVEVGLWHAPGHDCPRCPAVAPDTWLFHDWAHMKYTPGATVKLKRAKSAELQDKVLVEQVWARDCIDPARPMLGRCRYCGNEVRRKDNRSEDRRPEMDHVDPTKAAGVRNVVLSCRACNRQKGARTPEQAGMTLLPPPRPSAEDIETRSGAGPATPGAAGHTTGSSRPSPAAPAAVASGPADDLLSTLCDPTPQRASTGDEQRPQQRPAAPDVDQPEASTVTHQTRTATGPPADHGPDHARYQRDSAVPGARAPGQGQGQGPGEGKGRGVPSGSPPPRADGESRSQARRRRRRGRRGRGGSTAGVDHRSPENPENIPDFIPPTALTSGNPMDAGAAPEVLLTEGHGSPWFGWRGPPSTVDDNHCLDHHLPQPCWKCADERND